MKRGYIVVLLLLAIVVNSCFPTVDPDPVITSPIVISNQQHHVGDNEGAEGLSLFANFDMPNSFTYAELDVTYVYPDADGTSGPDVDTPPEITINGYSVGDYSGVLKEYPECITDDREFQCTITITFEITDLLWTGENEFRITSKSFLDNYDDFTFSDVIIRFN